MRLMEAWSWADSHSCSSVEIPLWDALRSLHAEQHRGGGGIGRYWVCVEGGGRTKVEDINVES